MGRLRLCADVIGRGSVAGAGTLRDALSADDAVSLIGFLWGIGSPALILFDFARFVKHIFAAEVASL